MQKLREEPERYDLYLQKRREYYNEVIKPRKKQLKNDKSI